MAKNTFAKGITGLLLALVLCFQLVHIPAYAAESGSIPISDKIEIEGKEEISLEGFNAFAIKQSTGTIIWVRNNADADNPAVIEAIRNADPSIKDYVVVSGDGTFHFNDYYTGNPYKDTYFTVAGDQLFIYGDYSHVSLFWYGPHPEPDPNPDPEPDPDPNPDPEPDPDPNPDPEPDPDPNPDPEPDPDPNPDPEPDPDPNPDPREGERDPRADVPKTGDPMLAYTAVTILSGLGLFSLTLTKKKKA